MHDVAGSIERSCRQITATQVIRCAASSTLNGIGSQSTTASTHKAHLSPSRRLPPQPFTSSERLPGIYREGLRTERTHSRLKRRRHAVTPHLSTVAREKKCGTRRLSCYLRGVDQRHPARISLRGVQFRSCRPARLPGPRDFGARILFHPLSGPATQMPPIALSSTQWRRLQIRCLPLSRTIRPCCHTEKAGLRGGLEVPKRHNADLIKLFRSKGLAFGYPLSFILASQTLFFKWEQRNKRRKTQISRNTRRQQ